MIYQITGEHIPMDPWKCLFYDTEKMVAQYRNTHPSSILIKCSKKPDPEMVENSRSANYEGGGSKGGLGEINRGNT